ncbi:hypothetical protein B0H17DRAFT_1045302, partial [Mycena rosella]
YIYHHISLQLLILLAGPQFFISSSTFFHSLHYHPFNFNHSSCGSISPSYSPSHLLCRHSQPQFLMIMSGMHL